MTQHESETERLIEQLDEYKSDGTKLISIYVPPDTSIESVQSRLQSEYAEARNIKSKQTRKHVQNALSSLNTQLSYYDSTPDSGLAAFSGAVKSAAGKENYDFIEVLTSLPEPVSSYRYHCGDTFLLDPLRDAVDSGAEYGLVVLDSRTARIGYISGTSVTQVAELTSNVPGKHSKGGWSQQRFERRRREALSEFLNTVCERITRELLTEPQSVSGIIVGGPMPMKKKLLDAAAESRLENAVLGLVDIGDTSQRGLQQLANEGADLIQESERVHQRAVVDEFLEALRGGTTSAVYGVSETLDCLREGAVETLLISPVERQVHVGTCEYGRTVTVRSPDENCPYCGEPITVESQEELVEYATSLAENRGTTVEQISSDFDKGSVIDETFNGIAGILRYQPTR